MLWRESIITTGKKSSILLWRESFITTGKKSSSRLSGGLCCCVRFLFWREIGSFFIVAGKFYYDRKKKFKSSVWRVVLLCQFLVLAITTEKKSSSRLSGGLCCCVSFRFWRLRPEKKVQVVIKFVLVQLELKLIQIR